MKKKCDRCEKEIKEGDRWVLIGTYDHKGKTQKTVEETHYHIKCWSDYFNERVQKKFEIMREKMMGMAGNIVGNLMANTRGRDF